jgi:hypothetical protein
MQRVYAATELRSECGPQSLQSKRRASVASSIAAQDHEKHHAGPGALAAGSHSANMSETARLRKFAVEAPAP